MKSFQVFQNAFFPCLVTLSFLLKGSQAQTKNITFWITDTDEIGIQSISLNIEECTTNLEANLPIYLNTHGHCVTLYKDKNCTGDFVVIQKTDKKEHMDSGFFNWESSNGTLLKKPISYIPTYERSLKSIGPCFSKCDPRNIEKAKEPVIATFVDGTYHFASNVTLAVNGCTHFPTSFKRRVGLHVLELGQHHTCFEYHKQSDCMGEYSQTRLRHLLRSFTDHSLRYLVNYDKKNFKEGNDAVAVSLCGFQCKTPDKLLPTSTLSPEVELNAEHVRIYDDKNFSGFSKDVNMSGGCVDLNDEWEGQLISIKTNGLCTILYDKFGCNSTSAKTLPIVSDENDYYFSKFSKNTRDFPSEIKSLSKCPTNSSREHNKDSRELQQSPDSKGTSFFSFIFIMFLILSAVALLSLGVAHLVLYSTRKGGNNSIISNMNLYDNCDEI